MPKVIIHLGSNLGDRIAMLRKAIDLLSNGIGRVLVLSSVYETEPWGLKEQAHFLNMALIMETEHNPLALLQKLKQIESDMGAIKEVKWGPRAIDMDIILFGDQKIDSDILKIPHPSMHNRNFVLIPVMEIAGDWVHPFLEKTVEELYEESTDDLEVYLIDKQPFTKIIVD
jgi:2-amino-4-hydroxy-6-hydroxymethyldihydropteridine diphosphokinase